MYFDRGLVLRQDIDLYRLQHLLSLLSRAKVEDSGTTWEEIAVILSRIRRKRLRTLLVVFDFPNGYNGTTLNVLSSPGMNSIIHIIDNPIIVSNKNFNTITRYIWQLLLSAPEEVLRREIKGLSQTIIYGDDARKAISQTQDRKSLAYAFLALQRKRQPKQGRHESISTEYSIHSNEYRGTIG
jgi:hypothetical protein